ncbi:MAG: hypothetical protein HWE15_14635 [Algoriphagus sp.]|uniref:toxin-antitoxin system YwqK family antitoxin n=1 Tax=Algoriphagus sp. TaxID=1872435 RepID=UPI0017D9D6E3|nr:hypothetical protein [Algoriphagus sp.]NVJ87541.1 hypothetical protein [Algoriphagus sp.]
MQRISFLFLLLIFCFSKSWAQTKGEKQSDPDSTGVVNSSVLPTTMPLLLFDDRDEKEEKKEKKKKERKNIYFGIKTKRAYLRQNNRGQEIVELFNYTDASRQPDPYIRDVYWYDPGEKTIKNENYQAGQGYLLHGPYERRINEVVVESGMYYYGMKHDTWMLFDARNVLQDKNHYKEGWPRESRISYYNRTSKTIEKITPIQYGLEEGYFFYFYEDRQVAVTGEYRFGQKVGLWTEYWDTNNTRAIRKREIQYQEEPYMDEFKPYIRAEWDQEGNLVYRSDRAN